MVGRWGGAVLSLDTGDAEGAGCLQRQKEGTKESAAGVRSKTLSWTADECAFCVPGVPCRLMLK